MVDAEAIVWFVAITKCGGRAIRTHLGSHVEAHEVTWQQRQEHNEIYSCKIINDKGGYVRQ